MTAGRGAIQQCGLHPTTNDEQSFKADEGGVLTRKDARQIGNVGRLVDKLIDSIFNA